MQHTVHLKLTKGAKLHGASMSASVYLRVIGVRFPDGPERGECRLDLRDFHVIALPQPSLKQRSRGTHQMARDGSGSRGRGCDRTRPRKPAGT